MAGAGAHFIFGVDPTSGLTVGLIGYLASYYVARFFWFRNLDKQSTSKMYTTGLLGYFMLFLFTWILLFTLASA